MIGFQKKKTRKSKSQEIRILKNQKTNKLLTQNLKILKSQKVRKSVFQKLSKFGNSENSFTKPKNYYNLDLILSVGYRTNSKQATKFRRWATSILKNYLLKGYSINQKLLQTKTEQIAEIQETLNFLVKSGKNLQASDPFLEVLNRYTDSLITLNQFDEDRIQTQKGSEGVKLEPSN